MRELIVATARSYLGVPFKFRGRTPAGLDCWGFVRLVLDKLKLMPGCDAHYIKMTDTRTLFYKHLTDHGAQEISIDATKSGDLILLCDYTHRELVHCGFRAERSGAPSLIHCSVRAGEVTEISLTGAYKKIAFTAYRLPGVD